MNLLRKFVPASSRVRFLTLIAICLTSLFAVSANATNYTVKSSGGGNYTTIQSCANAMSAGDTCTVYAGTYNENVSVPSGTSGNFKTITVNGSDVVYVESFTIGSYVKIIGNCPRNSTQGTCGFSIQNPSSPTNAPCVSVNGGATDYYITNNNLYACGPYMIYEPDSGTNTTYGYIQGNTLSYSCSTSSAPNVCTAMKISGDYHLIENNSISHVSDGPYIEGKHNVYRNNDLGPTTDADCGGNGSNCHIDFLQADANVTGGGQPAQYLLMEGNTIHDMVVTGSFSGSGAHSGPLLQAEACNGQCYNAILRFHTAYHIAGGGTTNDNSGTTPPPQAWINVKEYNNDWIDQLKGFTGAGWGVNGHSYGSSGSSNVNELYYFTAADDTEAANPYMCLDTGCNGYTYGHDLAYMESGSGGPLYGHLYGQGAFSADPGNLTSNPLFNNYANNDFSLQSGSPALNAGTYLTTVASGDSGSGTSLVVNDAGFFQAGSPLVGVQGDCIAVGTVSNHVCATAINYSTNTITLASPISRSNGQSVWLYSDSTGTVRLTGTAPNIGSGGSSSGTAGSGSTPAAPVGLTASAQ